MLSQVLRMQIRYIALFLAFLILVVVSGNVSLREEDAQAANAVAEEFVGPFRSWRQVQCTGVDDTALLQSELNTLGRSGSPVLYIKPGTCRIMSTLHLGQGAGGPDGVLRVTILGHDPADTKIQWAGPSGMWQRMIEVNGVAQARFGRLTWDGGGGADIVYFDNWPGTSNYFPTGNRHEDEVFQHLWPAGGIAFYVGANGFAGSEWEYMRCKFIGPMEAGIYLANQNALNHWVWDSLFQGVKRGVANTLADRSGGGGGDWGVNRSAFLNNAYDMAIANTGFFSSRWNYSRGSDQHINGLAIGAAPAPWTSLGETIIDPAQQSDGYIGMGNVGSLGVLDATVRGGRSQSGIAVYEGYSNNPGGDIWSLHNTFSNPSRVNYGAGYGQPPARWHLYTDDVVGATVTDPGPPSLPPTPPPSSAAVIDVQNGDIAAALAQAGNLHVIVHIPYGAYTVTNTLQVGPNVILTGDGYGTTQLNGRVDPVLHLAGPSHAVLRDFSISAFDAGTRLGSGILIDNADQPGGLVHAEQWLGGRNNVGLDASSLHQTTVDFVDSQASTNSHTDSGGVNPSVDYRVTDAKVHIYNGAGSGSDAIYDLHGGELVAETMYYEGNPSGVSTALVTPNSSGTLVLDIGSFNATQGTVDTSTFGGLFTLNGIGAVANGHRVFGPNSLVMGFDFGSAADTTAPTFTGAPYALWLPRHNHGDGSADLVPEQSAGVADESQFLRDHMAPLRAAKPLSLDPRPASVTDVRLYRVGAMLTKSGVRIVGSPASPPLQPPASPTPQPTASSTPQPTASPTLQPTATPKLQPSPSPTLRATRTPRATKSPTPQPTPRRSPTAKRAPSLP
jgi:hypothetical protein